MIRILHTEWSEGFGGQEIRILNEMEEMHKLGCYLALATRKNAKILQKAQERGFVTYTLPFNGKSDLKTIWQIHNILKNNQFDIINTHSGIDTWCGGLASIRSGAKFIRTRHLSNKIHPSRLNFINSLADFIITTGEKVRQTMIRENRIKPNKILSIPTGIDETIFNSTKYNKMQMRMQYGIPQDVLVVGNLGIMRGFKRQDIFIEVAQEICQKYPNILFIIAGSGDNQIYLENLAKETNLKAKREIIRCIGYTKKPAEFLATLDFFLLTSDKNEGVPQSLMQALLMNIPSIASDIGSIADLYLIQEGKPNFILTPKPNKEEFIRALESLLRNPNIIQTNREFIVKNFSLSSMGERIMQIYQKIV
ncbi:glycosyltransferase family 4 protein [uncultured Helicobacter sp.]|uniref:glycosyltransferase family 4 protein n=1 Tax=uncultured Helicobacter sp. TaxID=175537 RepID=UPI00261F605A|nr:glycosyltransferase family 4 protein [uncultured Helicobacter sp.]